MGHGWVIPNPTGMKARCGGPALCSECKAELAGLNAKQVIALFKARERTEFSREEVRLLVERIEALERKANAK